MRRWPVANDRFGVEIGFVEWMSVGCLNWPLCCSFTRRVARTGCRRVEEAAGRGRWSNGNCRPSSMGAAEKRVMVLFLGTAPLDVPPAIERLVAQWELALNDTVAVVAAIACFALPAGGDQTRRNASLRRLGRLPWDILLLFGGTGPGQGIRDGRVGRPTGRWGGRPGWSAGAMLILVTAIGLFATELMSNLALTLLLTPVAGILAIGMGHPLYFAAPVSLALAPSCCPGDPAQRHRLLFRPHPHGGDGLGRPVAQLGDLRSHPVAL